jgi:hypothetical protein
MENSQRAAFRRLLSDVESQVAYLYQVVGAMAILEEALAEEGLRASPPNSDEERLRAVCFYRRFPEFHSLYEIILRDLTLRHEKLHEIVQKAVRDMKN